MFFMGNITQQQSSMFRVYMAMSIDPSLSKKDRKEALRRAASIKLSNMTFNIIAQQVAINGVFSLAAYTAQLMALGLEDEDEKEPKPAPPSITEQGLGALFGSAVTLLTGKYGALASFMGGMIVNGTYQLLNSMNKDVEGVENISELVTDKKGNYYKYFVYDPANKDLVFSSSQPIMGRQGAPLGIFNKVVTVAKELSPKDDILPMFQYDPRTQEFMDVSKSQESAIVDMSMITLGLILNSSDLINAPLKARKIRQQEFSKLSPMQKMDKRINALNQVDMEGFERHMEKSGVSLQVGMEKAKYKLEEFSED